MGLLATMKQTWLRRNTVFLASVFGAAFGTELVVDYGVDRFWEFNNRGVPLNTTGPLQAHLYA
jgi:hypothetical protein